MIYGSVCSGIEAATVAWHGLGWRPAFFSEIEAFPRAVLAYHWPHVPLRGDFTEIQDGEHEPIDLLVGGTPCQDFSVAGLRAGLAGKRGQLTIEFVSLLGRLKPRWFVWENVPGVLSADKGRAFGVFLGALDELGYNVAWRVLDAQYFGVPQRRRRIFVVGHIGSWIASAAVLFEPQGVYRGVTPRSETRNKIARGIEIGPGGGGYTEVSPTLDARCKDGFIRNQLGVGAIVANTVAARTGPGRNGLDLDTYVPVQHDFPVTHLMGGGTTMTGLQER